MKQLFITISFLLFLSTSPVVSNPVLLNPYNREDVTSLNGKWNVIIDPFNQGMIASFYQNRKIDTKTDFVEYAFNDAVQLDVPGDFNSQMPELKYYEGNLWYQRLFNIPKTPNKRQILYFAGANYLTKVWLNGKYVGQHEGGFSPFCFDITDIVREGDNDMVVLTNNARKTDNVPALKYDWWNYGGITRDVMLIKVPDVHISDYKIQLKKGTTNIIAGYIQLSGAKSVQNIKLAIPELKIDKVLTTDVEGHVAFELKAKPELWCTDAPKLYKVVLKSEHDIIQEEIGFRDISVNGTQILLNGKQVFLKGVNFHEEIPQRAGRAYSESDALLLLNEVKSLGCNFIRTAHYPQNEYIVRQAEKMGIMIWEEIPVWQRIDFTNPSVREKTKNMLNEMIARDQNRAAVIMWSIANETFLSDARNIVLKELIHLTRKMDDTRLVSAAFSNPKWDVEKSLFQIQDTLHQLLDVVGINIYIGWYDPFPIAPEKILWKVAVDKPLIITEFGGEAVAGREGEADIASSWSENYQEKMYQDNVIMFDNVPNLSGTAPWTLFDFRSPLRCHKQNQDGWNRKGLISDRGLRKKAWYVMKRWYEKK